MTDCDDPDCRALPACAWLFSAESGRHACRDGIDNDGDGRVDCADPDCLRDPNVPYCNSTLAVSAIVAELDARAQADGWGRFHVGGVPSISEEYTRVIQHDMRTFLPITAALVGLVLAAIFCSWRGILLPLGVVGLAVVWGLGAMMGSGGTLNMINSSMPTLLLVIAVADSVHIVARYYEEAERSTTPLEATSRTMRHMAGACLLTTMTSAVGFASLLSAQLPIIRDFGLYTGLAIALAYFVTILLIPAVLGSLPLPHPRQQERARRGAAMAQVVTDAMTRAVRDHRRLSAFGSIAFCSLMVWGVTLVEQNSHIMKELHPSNPAAIANAAIEENHGGVLSGAIVFHGPPNRFADPSTLQAIAEVAEFAEAWRWRDGRPLVSRTVSVVDVVSEAHAQYHGDPSLRVIPPTEAAVVALLDQIDADERSRLLSADYATTHITLRMFDVGSAAWSALRAELTREIEARPGAFGDLDWYFTGSSTLGQEAMGFMTRDLITSLFIATVIIMALMSLLFRSLKLGLISMIPNLLPLLVTLGLVGLLGIELRVSTAVVFSISLGIAVDDTIHVLVRFGEELAKPGADYDDAMFAAIRHAGRAVLFSTIILCIGFGTLWFSEFTAVRELGLLGGATLLSALFGDLLVLPLVLLWLRPNVRPPAD